MQLKSPIISSGFIHYRDYRASNVKLSQESQLKNELTFSDAFVSN